MKTKQSRTKRGNGQGSVFRQEDPIRGTRWVGSLSVRALSGKRRRVRVYGATAEEADRKLAKLKIELLADSRPADGAKESVAEYLTRWLTDVKPTVRASTYRSYEQIVRLHLVPALGGIALHKLSVRDVQWFVNSKAREERPLGGAAAKKKARRRLLSPRTVDYMRVVLRAALADALKQELLGRNVAALAESPKQKRYRGTWLDAEQAKRFVESLSEKDLKRALYTTAIATGARQGELLALRWQDVDLDAGVINIRHTLQRIEKAWKLLPPKTDESTRSVPVASFALAALKAHKQQQAELRMALGKDWQAVLPGLVFTNETGGPLESCNVTHSLKRRLKQAGLPVIRFHDLRHSTASLLLKQGVAPRVVADVLGHADIRTTLNVYSHVADEVRTDAVAKLGQLFQTA